MFVPNYWKLINLAHFALLGPLLAWTGWCLLKPGMSVPSWQRTVLLLTGLAAIAFHSFKAYKRMQYGAKLSTSYGLQINLTHALFIAPLMA